MVILFDLDGVLVDIYRGGLALFGKSMEACRPGVNWIPDMIGCTEAAFWDKVDASFGGGLEKIPDADAIIGIVADLVEMENIGILTSPAKKPKNLLGKAQW